MIIFLSLQAFLFLISFPMGPSGETYSFWIIAGINATIVNPISTISIAAAVMLQARTTWMASGPGALSRMSLSLQVVTFMALSILWPMRLKLPPGLGEVGTEPGLLTEWYAYVGWACVNSVVVALGQAVVLCASIRSGGDESDLRAR
jgi:hypothetical protein